MIEPTPVQLTGDAEQQLRSHLRQRINSIKDGLKPFHETKLPEWRRMYEGRPLEKERVFPFRNAANLVVPLVGIHSDTLQARIMAAIWKTMPVFPVRLFGIWDDAEAADKMRIAWEAFLGYNAIEPEELDLYRTEEEWIGETCRYGTSVIKVCNEQRFLDAFHPAGDGSGKFDIVSETDYDGPMPVKLALEDFGIPPSIPKWELADIMYHRVRLQKHQLLERQFRGIYDKAQVDKIIDKPDRNSQSTVVQQREEDSQRRTSSNDFAEWDIYECWLPWREPNAKQAPRIIAWYHLGSDTLLRAIYDFYPDRPFVLSRLLYRDDSIFGYGMCETIGAFQEEISQIHNQRRDKMTLVNSKVWRVSPQSKLNDGFEIYPSAMLPAEKDEIEPMSQTEPMTSFDIEEEKLSIDLAERRSGVSPPMQGYGAAQESRSGVSATGTLSILQEGNNRTDLNIADMRFAHLKLGRIISRQYAMLGLDDKKLSLFGTQADDITKAAQLVKDGKLGLRVSVSTASVNKEVEKQSDMMLSQILNAHYQQVSSLIQGISSALTPEPMRAYLFDVIKSTDKLMKSILRNFDRDDAEVLVPKVNLPQGGQSDAGQAPQAGGVQPPSNMAQLGSGGGLPQLSQGLGGSNGQGTAAPVGPPQTLPGTGAS